jgi:hypothetical protein
MTMKSIFTFALVLFLTAAVFADDSSSTHERLFFNSHPPIVAMNQPSNTLPANPSVSSQAPKTSGKAFIMSLILPGWGQRYVGAKTKSELFFGLEAGLWLSYAGFTSYSSWREDDYRTYAATYAGVDLKGKTSSYFIDVGNFGSVYEYNAYRLRQRNTMDLYSDEQADYWQWQSSEDRQRFNQLRVSSDTARNRATFVLGAIVANHIFSAIEAVWSVHQYEKGRLSSVDWNLQFGGLSQPMVHLAVQKHF